MRHITLFLAALLTITTTSAYAAGVLLPNSNNATTDVKPNLGLGTLPGDAPPEYRLTPPANKDSTTPRQMTEEEAKALAAAKQTSGSATTPQTPVVKEVEYEKLDTNIKPGGTISKEQITDEQKAANKLISSGMLSSTSTTAPRNDVATKLRAIAMEQERKYDRAPSFLEDIPYPASHDPELPNSVNLSVTPDYSWGYKDAKFIERVFGYQANQIPSSCQLRMRVTIHTDKPNAMYGATLLAGAQDAVRYDGNVVSVEAKPFAICFRPARDLPKSSAIILKTGDKYTLQLPGRVKCQLDTRTPGALSVMYMGDDKGRCSVR